MSARAAKDSSRYRKRRLEDVHDPVRRQRPRGAVSDAPTERAARFQHNLEQGPSGSGESRHRQQSPTKSSLSFGYNCIQDLPVSFGYNCIPDLPESPNAPKASQKNTGSNALSSESDSDGTYCYTGAEVVPVSGTDGSLTGIDPIIIDLPWLNNFKTLPDDEKDGYMCGKISDLIRDIVEFAKDVPTFAKSDNENARERFFTSLLANPANKQLIRYLGRLAIGDGTGEKAWFDLLTVAETRQALVVGILGQALKEHVFGALFFAGSPATIDKLKESETAKKDADGFERTQLRAEIVEEAGVNLECQEQNVENTASQLWAMLEPFWAVGKFTLRPEGYSGRVRDMYQRQAVKAFDRLKEIVQNAADVNLHIRHATDVVYYWPPTFKDEEFEPARMEALNLSDMIRTSPYEKVAGTKGGMRAKLGKDQQARSEAIVRIVCFPGLVAYRQFGGDLAKKELEAEEDRRRAIRPRETVDGIKAGKQRLSPGQSDPAKTGFRSRVICKSVVFLQWGKQRLLTREAGTSTHIDAMRDGKMQRYTDDTKGYVELFDLFLEKHPELNRKEKPDS